MRRWLPLSLLMAWALLDCGGLNLRAMSSGHIGCPEQEVVISDQRVNLAYQTWTADCRGQRYHCIRHSETADVSVSCQPATAPAVAATPGAAPGPPARPAAAAAPVQPAAAPAAAPVGPAAAPVGCQYDMQCKGDRICRAGSCVDP